MTNLAVWGMISAIIAKTFAFFAVKILLTAMGAQVIAKLAKFGEREQELKKI